MQYYKVNFHRLILLLGFILSYSTFVSSKSTISQSNGDTLELIGIGMYQELHNDIYIGALYGPANVPIGQLLDEKTSKRMTLKFVSQYSNRKMKRHWKEGMSINNPRKEWQPLTREIVNFAKLFKRPLQAGDEIVIDYSAKLGTEIIFNGTLFKTIDNPAFSTVILNVWLGNVPPTKAFKSNIQGIDIFRKIISIRK